MNKNISNHPFIFLTSLVIVASCCLFGFLQVVQDRNKSFDATVSVKTPVTDTVMDPATETTDVVIKVTDEATLPFVIVKPTATNSLITETTATSQPAIPSQTIEEPDTAITNPLVVHFIDVGQGDSILVVSPQGQTALIDGGSANTGVVAYLRGQGVERIDLMIATHPHEDHIGGLTQVLGAMPVRKVVTNGQVHTTATYEHFLDAILNSDAEYSEVVRGDTIAVGDMVFSVMNPARYLGDDLNENTIVLRLVYRRTTILFTGDAGMEAEASMMAEGLPLSANVLKVGHHGSCTGTSKSFLQVVNPEVGIYTAGLNNQYDLPCVATIYALDQRGILVLGTDVEGSIIVNVNEDGYQITNSAGEILWR